MNAVLTREEVGQTRRSGGRRRSTAARGRVSGERAAPPKGGDGSRGAAGNVGGYNTFWLDPGSTYTIVNGRIRTSIVVDPPDGRLPPLTPAARQRIAARLLAPAPSAAARTIRDSNRTGAYDDPERRPLGERCLLGFGSTSGPPALPNYFYNNLHQIVQTPDRVLILNEMVHDARIIRMNAQHLPKHIRKWMGDSIGRWEGDTLVVDTTNFNADRSAMSSQRLQAATLMMVESIGAKEQDRLNGPGKDLHVIERFTRVAENALLYRFTIEDPATWARRGPVSSPGRRPIEHIYEYACHEANYALEKFCAARGSATRRRGQAVDSIGSRMQERVMRMKLADRSRWRAGARGCRSGRASCVRRRVRRKPSGAAEGRRS